MKKDEAVAFKFLESLGFSSIMYEPDGNITPDFLLDKSIAVEVTRLNQNYVFSNGKLEGFEKISVGAWQRIEKILKKLGPSIDGECWNVIMQFRRPLDWKSIEPQVASQLAAFKNANSRKEVSLKFGDNFELEITQTRRKLAQFFTLLGSSNLDAGGSILALVEQNLRHCVANKQRTVAGHLDKYKEWWLVLVNRIDLNMEVQDYLNFGRNLTPPIEHSFSKILLINPRDVENWFEV